jgi:hypothetical protein
MPLAFTPHQAPVVRVRAEVLMLEAHDADRHLMGLRRQRAFAIERAADRRTRRPAMIVCWLLLDPACDVPGCAELVSGAGHQQHQQPGGREILRGVGEHLARKMHRSGRISCKVLIFRGIKFATQISAAFAEPPRP